MGCALLVAVLTPGPTSAQARAASSQPVRLATAASTSGPRGAGAPKAPATHARKAKAGPSHAAKATKKASAPEKSAPARPAKHRTSAAHSTLRAPAAARRALAVVTHLDSYRNAASQRLVRVRHGFDACSAPPVSALRAWSSTGFRTIGIYIGGRNRECGQPLLTSRWVRAATNLGWGIIPTYAGLQAPSSICGCVAIAPRAAWLQGVNSAREAIGEARALGIGPGNPIYDDMEAYQPGWLSTPAVLMYLEAWTITLHAAGYVSGVYGSLNSGIRDLASRYHSRYVEPDDIWFAHWDGNASSGDSAIPPGYWAVHRRIHQYIGSATVSRGGVVMNVDVDLADGAVVTAASLSAHTH